MSTGPLKRSTSTGDRSLARAAQYVLLKPSIASVGGWEAMALVAVAAVGWTGSYVGRSAIRKLVNVLVARSTTALWKDGTSRNASSATMMIAPMARRTIR